MKNKFDFRDGIEKVEMDKFPSDVNLNPASEAAALYDLIAEKLEDETDTTHNKSYKKELNEFLTLMKPKGIIIDIGCGLGLETAHFSNLGFNAVGIDISTKSVELARKLFPDVQFDIEDFSNSNVYDELKVDGIHEHLSLMNLPKEDIKRVLTLFYNSLVEGGLLQMSFEEDNPDKSGWYSVPISNTYEWEGKEVRVVKFLYLSYFSVDELKVVIQNTGLNIISIKVYKEEEHQRNIITALCRK